MIADAHAQHVISGTAGLESPPLLQTRLSTLVLIRWLAAAGQVATIVIVHLAIAPVPLDWIVPVVAASICLNLSLTAIPGFRRRLSESHAAWHMAFDALQLGLLVGLTGGLHNPFAVFLLAPVMVAAATLSVRATTLLAVMAVATLSVVAQWHLPLPWPEPIQLPRLYLFAIWGALSLGVMSVSLFTWRIADDARRLATAYAQSRLALAREQRVTEVGALAAAVAHEMNTPLGTICLIAREMESDPAAEPLRADLETLIGQAERCRDVLARLTRGGERGERVDGESVPFPSLVEMAALPHGDGTTILFDHHAVPSEADAPPPWIDRDPAILHGLGNFIQNAAQFARTRVEVDTSWGKGGLWVRIADDGPGFPPHLLDRLGEPYTSGRASDEGHFGLGVFIAVTLLERTGARIRFDNPPDGGAEVFVSWSENDGPLADRR